MSGTEIFPCFRPVHGALYFATNPKIQMIFFKYLAPSAMALSITVYGLGLFTVLPLKLAIYSLIYGPFGLPMAIWSFHTQCQEVVTLIISIWIMPYVTHQLYINVLDRKIVCPPKGRDLRFSPTMMEILWKACLFMLGLIPFIGWVVVIVLKAHEKGWRSVEIYWQLENLSVEELKEKREQSFSAYFAFGVVALLLEAIPLFRYVFMVTNVIAGMLWVADLKSIDAETSKIK
ncbi:hypothetical protein DICA3_A07712 [Diutina catenulata]